MDYSACSPGGQSGWLRRLALLLAVFAAACVHPPESRFPAVLRGPVLHADAELVTGAAALDAPLGPLELSRAWVRQQGQELRWHVVVANPTASGFAVTIVVRMLDASGGTTASDTLSFELRRGDEREIDARIPARDPAGAASAWRIEAWVRVLAAPDRRTLGGTG